MLYFILSLITFMGSISWTPMKNDDNLTISQYVIKSSIVQDYGKSSLIKQFININSDIFYGGCKVLIPKGAVIIGAPAGLSLLKENVHIDRYDWYTALYKEGDLKGTWDQMKRKSYFGIKIDNLDDLKKEDIESLSKKNPKLRIDNREKNKNLQISSIPPNNENIERKPIRKSNHKVYVSFIVIEENNEYKILPIVLRLDPEVEIKNHILKLNEGGLK